MFPAAVPARCMPDFLSINIDKQMQSLRVILQSMNNISENIALLQWTVDEAAKSSAWRELKAISHGVASFASKLRGKQVVWYTDNKPVVSIVRKGSMIAELQTLAECINIVCRTHSIELAVRWLPRAHNTTADYASRVVDSDDWGIHKSLFDMLNVQYGPFTIDRFANDRNTQLARYNSRFATPTTEAIDAFTQNWSADNNWLVPPPKLVPRVIKHLLRCQARGALVIPKWESAVFWPLLFPDGEPAWFVRSTISFPNASRFIVKGFQPRTKFGASVFPEALLALQLDASLSLSPKY